MKVVNSKNLGHRTTVLSQKNDVEAGIYNQINESYTNVQNIFLDITF